MTAASAAATTATAWIIFLFVFSGAPPARSQQPYGWQTSDCSNKHNDTGLLGYFCSPAAAAAPSSCESYLTFHVRPPYSDVPSVAALLGVDAVSVASANSATSASSPSFAPGTKILVPVTCSCTGTGAAAAAAAAFHYQRGAAYVARTGDMLLTIASTTFQGLSTCQAIEEQSLGGAAPATLLAGQSVTVPLRCACPSASQAAAGVRFLVSYLVDTFDEVGAVAARFGVDAGTITAANQLESDATIYPDTTLLIPVKSRPDISQLQSPPPPPPPPAAASVPSKKSSDHTGVYIGVGAAVAAIAVVASAVAVLAVKARKRRARARAGAILATANKDGKGGPPRGVTGGEVSVSISDAFSSLSDIKSSLKVYSYDEVKAATGGFTPDRLVGGSVYRAVFNGDAAAVEVVDRDVSAEVEMMVRVNHFNLVRLTGVCRHGGRWYLVSEYAEHGTLRDRLAGAAGAAAAPPLSWAQRVQVALDVAEGLRYLHGYARPPYVHMDVRAGSVLLDAALRGKVRNLGAARVIRGGGGGGGGDAAGDEEEGREMFTMTSSIAGTRGYMAPEYLEHGVVSPKADVYSLGVVLLELVTGKDVEELEDAGGGDPFTGLNALLCDGDGEGEEHYDDVARRRLEELVDPAMAAAGSCPEDAAVLMMARLIERCVQRDAAARPGMGDVAQHLLKLADMSASSWPSSSEHRRSSGGDSAGEPLVR